MLAPMARKPKLTQEEQSKRFEEAAREAGVDTRQESLERLVRKLAKKRPVADIDPNKP